jgi:hypothetical protein
MWQALPDVGWLSNGYTALYPRRQDSFDPFNFDSDLFIISVIFISVGEIDLLVFLLDFAITSQVYRLLALV